MPLVIANRQRDHLIDTRLFREITTALLGEMAGDEAVLEVNFVSPARMAQINQTHLQHQGPTDIITFDYREPASGAQGSLHGELFICPAVAGTQAREFGTHWTAELVRYVIHGILHLQGFDDLAPAPRRLMKRAEGRWLRRISRRFALRKLARSPKLPHGKKKSPRALAG